MTKPAFSIDVRELKSRSKASNAADIDRIDRAGEVHGFVERPLQKKRGRPASPRTGQVHAKVLPEFISEISAEARRRGVQQGVLIEEAWQLYREKHDL